MKTPVFIGFDVVADSHELAERLKVLATAAAERAAAQQRQDRELLPKGSTIGTDYFSDVTGTPEYPDYQPVRSEPSVNGRGRNSRKPPGW